VSRNECQSISNDYDSGIVHFHGGGACSTAGNTGLGGYMVCQSDEVIDLTTIVALNTILLQLSPQEKLFEASPRGTGLDHFLVQLGMLLSGGREGGFFVMIGRRDS
jgi:hypothetical protein